MAKEKSSRYRYNRRSGSGPAPVVIVGAPSVLGRRVARAANDNKPPLKVRVRQTIGLFVVFGLVAWSLTVVF